MCPSAVICIRPSAARLGNGSLNLNLTKLKSMLLTIPQVMGVDESLDGNLLRRIAAPSREIRGQFSRFHRDRLNGWLFQPADDDERVLIVPPKTQLGRVPDSYERVLMARVGALTDRLDLTAAVWVRHPLSCREVLVHRV